MHKLSIRNIEVHAFHGCLPEEEIIGSLFSVDIDFEADFTEAILEDDLSKAVDYVVVHRVVRQEMARRSKLIEHVAGRILKQLKLEFPQVVHLKVSVTKFNPPVNGQLGKAVFYMEE